MARIPKYPYRVVTTMRISGGEYRREAHNYETLVAAMTYRQVAIRKPLTVKVEVMLVLDESTPEHFNGNGR